MTDISKPNHSVVNFALDYDGTVTSDPEGFLAIVKLLRSRGHKVYLVTMRYLSECLSDPAFMQFAKHVDGYFATARQAKKPFVTERGINIHIWIDDNPQAVHMHASQIWSIPSPEGQIVIEKHSN